jgi:hypothetical protein
MTEWWTYRPSDFLLFAPRTYYRLIELYNADVWPAQLPAFVTACVLLVLAWRGSLLAARVGAAVLAVSWAFVGWRFHFHHYATINWAAPYFACAFAAQALLLGAGAASRAFRSGRSAPCRSRVGIALIAAALVAQPLMALLLGRPWAQVEVVGLAPDPTAVFTLGFLLLLQRIHWWLFPIPLLWCLASGMTLWTMGANEAFIPPLAALTALLAASSLRPQRRTAGR